MLPFEFFFNKKSLKIILPFAAVASKSRITINMELEPSINVHLHYGTRMIFKKCGGGLYYFDTNIGVFYEDQTTEYTFINTVEIKNSLFHRQEIKGAEKAIIL